MKAQLGLEFFLVLSVALAFIMIIYSSASSEGAKTRVLEAAVSCKAFLDPLSERANLVALAGNGSRVYFKGFVPSGANCFYYDAASRRLYCTLTSQAVFEVAESNKVYGPQLRAVVNTSCFVPLAEGWREFFVSFNGTGVVAEC